MERASSKEAVMTWDLGAGLDGRVVMVTGAGGGIGSATASAFIAAGAQVVAVDLDADRVRAAIGTDGVEPALALSADLVRLDTHAALLEQAASLGPVYALVHCAAVLRRRADVREITEEDWDAQLDTNLKASFFLCRSVAESMRASGTAGRIVTFSSQGWWTGGFGGSVVYAASKGGIVSMTRGLARTYGPFGITVNTIAPGQAKTSMLLDDIQPEVLERMTAETPLGRIGEPDEIAGVAVFLASQHASFVSGATLNVSGGFLMY
jgi:NAD(P)-dependent dehydrogenase (short-subunit alcohol dehydrogenase family)